MADNVADALKNLNKELNEADVKIRAAQGDSQALFDAIVRGVGKSKDAFRSLVSELSGTNIQDARTIDIITRLVDENGKKLTPASIKATIENITKDNKPQTLGLFQYKTSDLNTLQQMLAKSKKDSADLLSTVLKISNASVGLNKAQGTAYSNALASRIKEEARARNKIIKLQERQLQLEQAIDRASSNKSGKTKFEGQMRSVADLNKELAKTARLISQQNAILQGSGRGQNVAKALGLGTAKKEADMLNNSLSKTIGLAQRLGYAFGIAFSAQGLVQFGRKLVETRGEFELQQVALRSILQNKQVADEIWDKTMQAALQSPFTAMQLTKYTKQLAAYRIETERLFDTTKRLADVSAGLGVDMQRLILAYGQVKAANYLRASEIRQFTEAGVNILGELSTYLSSTRGELISTAQVMDMVQKRMVTFEDVEAIFKRMTDEGGIFYNMQYVQSQTVKGQINKLHDAYDQMLNSIGKGNEGVLKDVVAALNNIVQNWRYWAAAIKSIAFGTIIASLTKLGVTLTGVNVAGIEAGKGMTKLAGGVKALGVALKGNWLTLAIGAVVSLAAELYNLNKRMESVNAEIDEQNLNLFETKERLEGYQDAIERNNKALEGSTGNEEKLKKKREENAEILAKLKNDYPQLAEGMEMQKNGVIDITDALKKENEELEKQITLNSLMKQSNIFDENFIDAASQLSQSYIKQHANIINAIAQARSLLVQMKQSGLSDTREYDIIYKISQINPSNIQEATRRIIELKNNLNFARIGNTGKPSDFAYRPLGEYWNLYLKAVTGTQFTVEKKEEELTKEFGNLENTIAFYLEKGMRDVDEYNKEIEEKFGGNFFRWYALNVNRVQKDIDSGVHDGYRFLRESLIKNGNANMPGMQDFYRNWMKSNLVDPYFRAWEQSVDELEKAGWRIPFVTGAGTPDPFATKPRNTKSESEILAEQKEKQGKVDAAWRRRISLLEEMKKRYDELSKSAYGYTKSEAEVRKAFEDSYNEIFVKNRIGLKGAIPMDKIDFTSMESMYNSFILLLEQTAGVSDAVIEELKKKKDSYGARIEIDPKIRIREDFARDIEDMFGSYELSLELQKLNIPQDVLNDMFDIDAVTIPDIRAKLDEWYAQQGADLNEEFFTKYQSYVKKLDDEERKLQKQRLKDYSKYLEYQLSERAKLEMDYVRKLAEVQSENAFTEQQKRQISEGLKREYEEAIAKQDWEDFKGSEFYVGMMEDLSRQGTASLEVMRSELMKLRDNAKNLSPRALKEMVNALEKIEEVERGRKPPFQRVREEAEKLKDIDIAKTFKDIADAEQRQADEQSRLKSIQKLIGARQEEQKQLSLISKQDSDIQQMNLEYAKKELEFVQRQIRLHRENKPSNVNQNGFRAWEFTGNQLEARSESLSSYIKQLETLEKVQKIINSDEFAWAKDFTLEDLLGDEEFLKEQLKLTDKEISNLRKLTDAFDRLAKAEQDALEEIKDYISKVNTLGKSVSNLLKNFGVETNPVTEWWEQMGDTAVGSITEAIDAIKEYKNAVAENVKDGKNLLEAGATGDYVRLAIAALKAIVDIIAQIGLFRGARIDKSIEDQKEKIDQLTMAYERLEKSIERTLSTSGYMANMHQMVVNIREQIEATEQQLALARSRKSVDNDEVRGYEKSLQDLYDQLDEVKQNQIEVFGGIGKDNYRSWAEGFVSAWKDAFLETGDGLDALQDHFDEFLQEWFVKQATMRIAGKALEGIMKDIDATVSDDGVVDWNELNRIREQMALMLPDLSERLADFAGMWDLGGEGGLSGLAAGIQGMTEEQANILEAYWNSVRMYTANINDNVARIASMLGVGGAETNPMLQQMSIIAENTAYIKSIYTMLDNSQRNLGQGKGFVTYQL